MSRTITIDPVTRIEGHSKITIQLDEAGEVQDARFHVTQFRGFERIVQGRPVHGQAMPVMLTPDQFDAWIDGPPKDALPLTGSRAARDIAIMPEPV